MERTIFPALGAFAVMLIAIFSFNTSALADTHYPIGEIVKIEGKVYLERNDSQKEAKEDDPVFMYSTIKTEPGAKVLFLLIDDTQMTLGESSELTIDEFVFDPYDSSENHAEVSVNKGTLNWISGLISKREDPDVTINTPKGSIGIRGTEFWAGNIEDGYGVFVSDGLIHFEGDWGDADLAEGDGIYLAPTEMNKEPDPGFWNSQKKAKAFEKVSFHTDNQNVQEKIQNIKEGNVKKRHDYRGQMFPYKENPYEPRLKKGDDQFFSDEFEEMRQKN